MRAPAVYRFFLVCLLLAFAVTACAAGPDAVSADEGTAATSGWKAWAKGILTTSVGPFKVYHVSVLVFLVVRYFKFWYMGGPKGVWASARHILVKTEEECKVRPAANSSATTTTTTVTATSALLASHPAC